MSSKQEAIKCACYHYDYRWPRSLPSGVMFFNGHRITIEEFMAWANLFNKGVQCS